MERPISSMNERTRSWRFEFLTQLDLDFKIWRFLLRFSFRDMSVSIEHVLQILFSIVWKIYVLRAEKRLFISAWKIFHKTRRSSYSLVPKLRTIYKKNDNSNDTISLVASSRRPSRQLQLVNGPSTRGCNRIDSDYYSHRSSFLQYKRYNRECPSCEENSSKFPRVTSRPFFRPISTVLLISLFNTARNASRYKRNNILLYFFRPNIKILGMINW